MAVTLPEILAWFVVFIFSTTCHEAAHAWVAYLGGDSTAYDGGQVTLDPMPHIRREPVGMVVFPLVSLFLWGMMFGFASAPVDPHWAQRNPTKAALMSAAGPIANFILAAVAFVAMLALVSGGILTVPASVGVSSWVDAPFGPGGTQNPSLLLLAKLVSVMLTLNVILGVFNLMPFPPLDGAGVLEGLFPESAGDFYQRVRASGMSILGLFVAMYLFRYVGWPVLNVVVSALYSFM